MKTSRNVMCILILILVAVSASTAYSSGYPALILLKNKHNPAHFDAVVVAKYESSSFTSADADSITQQIAAPFSASKGSSNQRSLLLTPSQLAAMGYTDADALKDLALNLERTYRQSLGIKVYVFLDINRVAAVSPDLGDNLRVDIWIADPASLLSSLGPVGSSILAQLGVTGDYLYVTSLETPEKYLSFTAVLSALKAKSTVGSQINIQ